MVQPLQGTDGFLHRHGALQEHGAAEQQFLLGGHIVKSSLQPLVLCLVHFHTVQEGEEAVLHCAVSIC